MTLGTRIQQLRKEHNMSQGDLAEALDISRQSVSKWETDTATPDLDKLLKLSEIFNVTLDELVKGDTASPNESQTPITAQETQQIPVTIKSGLETRQIVGIVLLCMAFLVVLVFTILGGILEGFLFSLPFLICGLICMLVQRHAGIYCAWAILIMLELLTRFAMSIHWQAIFQPYIYILNYRLHLILCWAHFAIVVFVIAITIRSFKNKTITFNTQTKQKLSVIFIVYLLLHFPVVSYLLQSTTAQQIIHGNWWIIACYNVLTTLGRLILFTVLAIYLLAWIRLKKQN